MNFLNQKSIVICFLLYSCIAISQVGIGTNNPNGSAVLELKSTTKGFLLPRITQVQRDLITPEIGLAVYCLDCLPKGLYVYDGQSWVTSATSSDVIEKDGLQYEEIVSPGTSRIWLDRNLGATQVATGYNDANALGDLYQGGRGTDGHEKKISPNSVAVGSVSYLVPDSNEFILNGGNWTSHFLNNTLWQGLTGLNNPCPQRFRIPTIAEFELEISQGVFTNRDTAFNSVFKFTVTGGRARNTGLISGSDASYWTSTSSGSHFLILLISPTNAVSGAQHRGNANALRCIKD